MKIPTFFEKKYIVSDNDARIRRADDLLKEEKYQDGDQIPAGSAVGDVKRIPKGTEVTVVDLKTAGDRLVFVQVAGANSTPVWTRASNLGGGMLNELVSFIPGDWDYPPGAENFTVVDKQSLIRGGKPDFASTGKTIPVGTYVLVTERAQNDQKKTFVKVSKALIENADITAGEEIGWTAASNLLDGCSNAFFDGDWTDPKGANSCWQRGNYIGSKILVNIIGTGSQMEQITLETLPAYLALKEAMAKDNLALAITSGFRTFAQQAELRRRFDQDRNNNPKAAQAGHSNHQHGKAFDLNTDDFGTPKYNWLKENGTTYGFVRTVSGEHWHWEPLPEIAAKLKKTGEFKTFVGK